MILRSPRRGLVFDFDGTIALSEPVHLVAWQDVAADLGEVLPENFAEKSVGATDAELARGVGRLWGDEAKAPEILMMKRRYYQSRCVKESVLVPGVIEALTHLREHFPIGLATSAGLGDITPTLAAHGLGNFFDVVLTVDSVTNPKPHPEIYLKASAALGIEPPHSYAFEDSPIGAAAARAAGLKVIGLTTTFSIDELGPTVAGMDDYLDLTRIRALVGTIA